MSGGAHWAGECPSLPEQCVFTPPPSPSATPLSVPTWVRSECPWLWCGRLSSHCITWCCHLLAGILSQEHFPKTSDYRDCSYRGCLAVSDIGGVTQRRIFFPNIMLPTAWLPSLTACHLGVASVSVCECALSDPEAHEFGAHPLWVLCFLWETFKTHSTGKRTL